jgi:dye decolorizing peroxidase
MTEGQLSRRKFLAGAGAIAGSVALGGAGGAIAVRQIDGRRMDPNLDSPSSTASAGYSSIEPFYGIHQAGIRTPLQTYGAFATFSLLPNFDRDAARRLLRVVTANAAKLASGVPPLSDNDPELASGPARLTVTMGLGMDFFRRAGLGDKVPEGFVEIPRYGIDRLVPEWSGGDFLLQLGADDPMIMAHALRHLTRSIRTFATPLWVQRGFSGVTRTEGSAKTPRNLMGQVDGTVNPRSELDFDKQVWAPEQTGWFRGGTMMVIRRIAMTLDTWDALDTPGKELAVGRRISSGAPLTGSDEFDVPDLDALGQNGLPVIPPFAHIRRARTGNDSHRFLRRPFHFDDGFNDRGDLQSGQIFVAYAASIERQYIPVQNALARQDILNQWTIPVGSAVFVIPPGCDEGGFIGEGLFAV